ncbi:2057_t:CDS:2, partial [Funneliformis caledonium]
DVFLPLESTTEYHYRSRIVLEDMSEQQYKLFHYKSSKDLNNSLHLDPTKKWSEISQHVSKNIMKEIGKVLLGRFRYKETELKWILQQLHRHRRAQWKLSLDLSKVKSDKKRKGTNS